MATPTLMQHLDDFIYENNQALESTICEDIIDRFEEDDRTFQGVTTKGEDFTLKKSLDLALSTHEDWKDIDDILFKSVSDNMEWYIDYLHRYTDLALWNTEGLGDNGYNVKRYVPGDYFNWHVDRQTNGNNVRTLAYIWYLNDNFEKGETQFMYGRTIKPQKGKLLIFPASWTYPHRGVSPKKGNKYIVTTFLSTDESTAYE